MTLRTPLTDAEDTALRDAIGKVAHGAIVTRYVIAAETIDADTGEPVIEDIAPNTQPIWDSVGLPRLRPDDVARSHRPQRHRRR